MPYLAGWAQGDTTLLRDTAQRVLATTAHMIDTLEAALSLDLTPDLLRHTANATLEEPAAAVRREAEAAGRGSPSAASSPEPWSEICATSSAQPKHHAPSRAPNAATERCRRVRRDAYVTASRCAVAAATREWPWQGRVCVRRGACARRR